MMDTFMFGGFGWVFWILIIALLFWLANTRGREDDISHPTQQKTARELLDEEYALGKIDRDSYLQKRADLSS